MIHRGVTYPRNLRRGTRKQHMLVRGGAVIYMSPELGKTTHTEWLRQNTVTKIVMVSDAAGDWMEAEVTMPPDFDGSPETGWSNGPLNLSLEWSKTLTTWSKGGWIAAPGKSTVTLANGWKKWFVRYLTVPRIYKGALVDFRMVTSRHGKSVTNLKLNGVPLSLPGYPYALPSQAATLQSHLIAAGYPGSTVTTSAGTWSAVIRDYTASETFFEATWSGDQITEVRNQNTSGTLVALPGYPYTMPAQEAALESDLIAAGFAYTQVTLFRDSWTIFLPNVTTLGVTRTFTATISPTDPFQMWTPQDATNGINLQALLESTVENVRVGGAVKQESDKGFLRLGAVPSRTMRMPELAAKMIDGVDSRLSAAAAPSTAMKLFTVIGALYTGSIYTPNPQNWLQDLRPQLTGFHMGAGAWTQSYALIPLGDRYVLSCGHNGPGPGESVKYVSATGDVFTTTITHWINDYPARASSDTKQAYQTDLMVCVLADPLPAWVYRAPIIALSDTLRTALDAYDPPTVAISQGNWTDGPTSPYGFADTPDNRMAFVKSMLLKTPRPALRDSFYHGAFEGDSGTPEYILLDDVLYLYRVITNSAGSGVYVGEWLPYINSLIARGATVAGIPAVKISAAPFHFV
jgi:hypothetical protein